MPHKRRTLKPRALPPFPVEEAAPFDAPPPAEAVRKSGSNLRKICFVTGTRAEFGLMNAVLAAIRDHPRLELQIVVTGMHLDPAHGQTAGQISEEGWSIDRVVPWEANSGRERAVVARITGAAMTALADAFAELGAQVVLVVGDRVEAFAAAAAAHLSGLVVAHIHGGDRAAGQVDDSLRHAITKLAHVHFPAIKRSEDRLFKLGEDRWRIHRAGSPGLDRIKSAAASPEQVEEWTGRLNRRKYALLVLHPVDADEALEETRARMVLNAMRKVDFPQVVIIHPNNDPGANGIIRVWDSAAAENRPVLPPAAKDGRFRVEPNVPRPIFLGLLRDAAVLVGNSSSGIIEAASFGTPVVDIGPRQEGRERGPNVVNLPYSQRAIHRHLSGIWNKGRPKRTTSGNIYGGEGAGRKIASVLADLRIDDRLLRKLIRY